MLIYLAAPYSNVNDKNAHMDMLMTVSGSYMVSNPGHHIVSPLFFHYSLDKVPNIAGDWNFWKNYSIDLLRRCDVVYCMEGIGSWLSTGVQAELAIAKSLNIPVHKWHSPDGKELILINNE